MTNIGNSATGPGHPDSFTGHGYFSSHGGPGNKTRPSQKGFPYDLEDLEPDFQDDVPDNSEEEELATKINSKTNRKYVPAEKGRGYRRDRQTFTKLTVGGPALIAGEGLIRLRSKSSEPSDGGTMYGWSSQPMWNEPRRKAGTKLPRFDDIIMQDEDEEFKDRMRVFKDDAIEEQLLRDYIRQTLQYRW